MSNSVELQRTSKEELEYIADVSSDYAKDEHGDWLRDARQLARELLAERERCAKLEAESATRLEMYQDVVASCEATEQRCAKLEAALRKIREVTGTSTEAWLIASNALLGGGKEGGE